ncbi:MAG: nucleoside triphosphate pyrophosphohydrolase [Ignavibacteriae bacterium]|nr:nucleoside triphosphate pyrophosphohydrolase [Ignavibacteriota bacterium]NOG96713.1 nucleoside triphosphate pyrophosphohydrolase [Ignavibacteriota bacterium]
MTGSKFEELVNVLRRLRTECPWDAEQTNESIKAATLEEAYEVIEAIDEKDYNELKGELGDLLLHIVFHSVIAEDEKHFKIDEVIDGITEKLIRRHPHVFGDEKVNHNHEIERNWEKIKLEEGRDSVLEGVPKNLPGLYKAFRLQQKASKIGFDWNKKEDVWEKVLEEINEMHEMEKTGDEEKLEKEIGDVIFSIVNYSRFIGVNPEDALRKTNYKFTKRFQYIEKQLKDDGKSITDSDLKEMDYYWEESKKHFS